MKGLIVKFKNDTEHFFVQKKKILKTLDKQKFYFIYVNLLQKIKDLYKKRYLLQDIIW